MPRSSHPHEASPCPAWCPEFCLLWMALPRPLLELTAGSCGPFKNIVCFLFILFLILKEKHDDLEELKSTGGGREQGLIHHWNGPLPLSLALPLCGTCPCTLESWVSLSMASGRRSAPPPWGSSWARLALVGAAEGAVSAEKLICAATEAVRAQLLPRLPSVLLAARTFLNPSIAVPPGSDLCTRGNYCSAPQNVKGKLSVCNFFPSALCQRQ